MNFVFSTPEACRSFSRHPDTYIKDVLNLARRKPQLVKFLKLRDQLEQVSNICQLVEERVTVKVTHDNYTQMEHEYVLPRTLDLSYKWNIWDHKRKALQLADMSKRKTISTQTMKSFSVNAMQSQTYLPMNSTTQTKHDSYANVPKPKTYLFGLRGRKDDKQFELDITQYDNK
ncbi:hypothetical protein JTB14_012578 [Gonioctena quinquepunctata]|nr:hypothetical protein JTB14_012578 [Gonioctena quinquepunctata]